MALDGKSVVKTFRYLDDYLVVFKQKCGAEAVQLLSTTRQLVGASNVNSNGALLKELFLQRLPRSTRIVLAAAGTLSLDHAAELADRVHDTTSPLFATLATTEESLAVPRLDTQIDQLAAVFRKRFGRPLIADAAPPHVLRVVRLHQWFFLAQP
ncbi:hypothetical protein HPB48_013283 [Haemaphysalis longicornis]|uniref:Uncharacterized protein n=1 Tax=Haemaphysalis longicornis TaxID=44386 RepID=A0A9J6GSQ0_HAELO|nr:hypothetical protein HPB48_013283 [Haemaphysalis longicornis]